MSEKTLWWCRCETPPQRTYGSHAAKMIDSPMESITTVGHGGLRSAVAWIFSDHAPTYAEFRDHIKETIGYELPEPEQEPYWQSRYADGPWNESDGREAVVRLNAEGWFFRILANDASRDRIADELNDAITEVLERNGMEVE